MFVINLLQNLLPSDLINEVLKYDAHTCCMKEIRKLQKPNYKLDIFNYYEFIYIDGVQWDFIYSENKTVLTMLVEFSFYKYNKNNNETLNDFKKRTNTF